jgi:hypothetical protein
MGRTRVVETTGHPDTSSHDVSPRNPVPSSPSADRSHAGSHTVGRKLAERDAQLDDRTIALDLEDCLVTDRS